MASLRASWLVIIQMTSWSVQIAVAVPGLSRQEFHEGHIAKCVCAHVYPANPASYGRELTLAASESQSNKRPRVDWQSGQSLFRGPCVPQSPQRGSQANLEQGAGNTQEPRQEGSLLPPPAIGDGDRLPSKRLKKVKFCYHSGTQSSAFDSGSTSKPMYQYWNQHNRTSRNLDAFLQFYAFFGMKLDEAKAVAASQSCELHGIYPGDSEKQVNPQPHRPIMTSIEQTQPDPMQTQPDPMQTQPDPMQTQPQKLGTTVVDKTTEPVKNNPKARDFGAAGTKPVDRDKVVCTLKMGPTFKTPSCSLINAILIKKMAIFEAKVSTITSRFHKTIRTRKVGGEYLAVKYNYFRDIAATHVIISQDSPLPSYIRVIAKSKSTEARYERPSKIIRWMRNFLRWILFVHRAFHHQLGVSTDDAQNSHEQLVDWIFMEFFSPDKALPVMGEVKCEITSYDRSAFKPPQRFLIDIISGSSPPELIHISACTIIRMWYQFCHSGIWQSHLEDEGKYQEIVSQVEKCKTYHKEIPARRCTDSPKSLPTHIGTLQIFSLGSFRNSKETCKLNPVISVWEQQENMKILLMEREIIKRVVDLYQSCRGGNNYLKGGINGYPIGLVFLGSERESNSIFVLRLLDKNKKIYPPSDIHNEIKSFLYRMRYLHRLLFPYLSKDFNKTSCNAHGELLDWLKEELFNPNEGQAIFGVVKSDPETLKNLSFTDLQEFLIDIFIGFHYKEELDQSFSTILGYWYKTFHNQIWEPSFQDDKNYWHFMSSLLRFNHVYEAWKDNLIADNP